MGNFEQHGILHYSAPHHDKIYDETHSFIKSIARKAQLPTNLSQKLVRLITKDITQLLPSEKSRPFRQLLPEGLKRECETLELARPDRSLNARQIKNHIFNYTGRVSDSIKFPKIFWAQVENWNSDKSANSPDKVLSSLPSDLRKLLKRDH
ncbi:MAG: hypothetical protein CME64_16810 [Halobacteriovoraceae bacterium]|nr:hypothetical protein [Halobacteriovoraceae bacterium]|tara:strand:- start:187416 stop:187868 length:453 start_codon:yes stop_codon:yes gene_type:complete